MASSCSMHSHVFSLRPEDLVDGSVRSVVSGLAGRLLAEQERLSRLIPDAPVGYHWEYEVERHDDLMSNQVMFRMRAKLREDT